MTITQQADELLSPEAKEWAARINAAWKNVCAKRQDVRRLTKQHGPKRETKDVEIPLADVLLGLGHKIKRQVKCPSGRVDIFDETANEIIECKAGGNVDLIVEAAEQLQNYECYFPGAKLAICIPHIHQDARWMASALEYIGIRFIELDGELA